ncbi:MAG: class I SAM-dependent methyltransferase [Pseudomonadota bacterium]
MNPHDVIQTHYNKEATNKGSSKESTMHDIFIRDKEIEFIFNTIDKTYKKQDKNLTILDVGCGNGYLLSQLSARYPDFKFHGLEFNKELYKLASERTLKNVQLIQDDCRKDNFKPNSFDIVISERVLINLLSKEDQITAIEKIYTILNTDGIFIMIESFIEPLVNLNKAQQELCLTEMKPAYHNNYLSESIIDEMKNTGFTEINTSIPQNYLSTHYFTARVLHESLRPENAPIRNTEFVKFLDAAFPPAIGNYSPLLFRVFTKNS